MSKRIRRRNARHRWRELNPAKDGIYHKPLDRNVASQTIGHLVYTPFTGMGLHNGFRGEEWFRYRMQIFKDYTLKSLLNQTSRSFVHWISFRKEEILHPEVVALSNYLRDLNYAFIFTFDGLMYHDDKFTKGLKNRLMNLGRAIRDYWMSDAPLTLREIFTDKNKTLPERLAYSLDLLHNKLEKVDWIYLTRLDSDDMLRKDAIEMIQGQPPFNGAYLIQYGYIFDGKRLAEYNPTENPPFHTLSFKAEDFFEPKNHMTYQSHEDIPRAFDTRKLDDRLYCVVVHRKNTSTIWNHPFRGEEVDREILKEFGI